ncbi:MAG TPA: hypothetical protein VI584_04020 [Nitrospiria bacterium]|nr:hypothetical protein [Nitrospiria bacterium]
MSGQQEIPMEDEDIVREIRGIEDAADRLILEAHEKVKELESATKGEIEKIEQESERELEMKADELRSALKEEREREESELTARFDADKKRLENVDRDTLMRLTDLAMDKICKG